MTPAERLAVEQAVEALEAIRHDREQDMSRLEGCEGLILCSICGQGRPHEVDCPFVLAEKPLAALRALLASDGWELIPDDSGRGEWPPDEVDVEFYCGNWESKDRLIGHISRRCGTYGPSGASHWRYLPLPPAAKGGA